MGTENLRATDYPELQPAYGLWRRYAPETAPYAFRATTLEGARTWQDATRPALDRALGFTDLPPAPLLPQLLESVDRGHYVREKWLLRTSAYTLMPVYVLIPKQGRPPYPTMLAFHGHGYGAKSLVGLLEDGSDREDIDSDLIYGLRLCERGFLVAVPEISCFGERQTDFSYLDTKFGQGIPSSCAHTAMLSLHLGGSAAGLRVHDGRRLVDYLETRADADISRLGAIGVSGGGMHTLFSVSVDPRIKACVIGAYYSTFKDSILAMHHCACNFVPGLWQFGEMYDLVGLIAPRPLMVVAGERDPIFPIAAVKSSVERAREVYAVFGAQDHIDSHYYDGGHSFHGGRAYDFLATHLAWSEPF